MILHLSHDENEGRFEEVAESRDEIIDFSDYNDYPSLKSALSRNRAIKNYSHILFDFGTETNLRSAYELLEAIRYLRTFTYAGVLVILPDNPESKVLAGELHKEHVQGVFFEANPLDTVHKITNYIHDGQVPYTEVISSIIDGQKEEIRRSGIPQFHIPDGQYLTIGFSGIERRTGTTTTAFQIAHLLKIWQRLPCIIDPSQAFITSLHTVYSGEIEIQDSIFSLRGLDFSNQIQTNTKHDIHLIDYGELCDDILTDWQACDVRILTGGAKAWELERLVRILRKYPQEHCLLLLSFMEQEEQTEIRELLGDVLPVCFAPYSPSLWKHTQAQEIEQWLAMEIGNVLKC